MKLLTVTLQALAFAVLCSVVYVQHQQINRLIRLAQIQAHFDDIVSQELDVLENPTEANQR